MSAVDDLPFGDLCEYCGRIGLNCVCSEILIECPCCDGDGLTYDYGLGEYVECEECNGTGWE